MVKPAAFFESYYFNSSSLYWFVTIQWNNNEVNWYASGVGSNDYASAQYNESGKTYHWICFG